MGDNKENAALKKEVSRLAMRVQELSTDNEDFEQIFEQILFEYGVDYAEALSARRHRRSFAQTCLAHPVGATKTLSETLGNIHIGHLVNQLSGSALTLAAVSRNLLSAHQELALQYPWDQAPQPTGSACN